jgi:hypothetical protein
MVYITYQPFKPLEWEDKVKENHTIGRVNGGRRDSKFVVWTLAMQTCGQSINLQQ